MSIKLKPEVKKQFISALTSGDYTQGSGTLRIVNEKGEHHCCLGVLTDLAVKAGVCEWSPRANAHYTQYGIFKDGVFEASVLPFDVAKWAFEDLDEAAYEENEGDVIYGQGWRESLIALNDAQQKNFIFIAEIIKEHL